MAFKHLGQWFTSRCGRGWGDRAVELPVVPTVGLWSARWRAGNRVMLKLSGPRLFTGLLLKDLLD